MTTHTALRRAFDFFSHYSAVNEGAQNDMAEECREVLDEMEAALAVQGGVPAEAGCPAGVTSEGANTDAWNEVRKEALALSGGRGIGDLLSAVDDLVGVACATVRATPDGTALAGKKEQS